MREFAWGRVMLVSVGLGLVAASIAVATGTSIGRSTILWWAAAGFWFLALTVSYGVRLKREGLVVFPAPWWHADPDSD